MERRQGLEQKLFSPETGALYPPGIWLALTGTIEDNRYPSAQTDLRMAVNNAPSPLSQLRVMLVASGTFCAKELVYTRTPCISGDYEPVCTFARRRRTPASDYVLFLDRDNISKAPQLLTLPSPLGLGWENPESTILAHKQCPLHA